nr:retrotransposon protein, putative, Ty1-copia subclass [Tanacetum cinerariifolium]
MEIVCTPWMARLNQVKLVLVYKKSKVLHRCGINDWVKLLKQACMNWKKERCLGIKGPSRVESMSGYRYFLSTVDDYSRRVWVHFLRHKNKAFNKFKEWKQLVENQTCRKLKKLRTDNGLEFCIQEFNKSCKKSGTSIHLTVAGTPQQNGLAERMNRTLLNKVRCLQIQSGLPDSFWAEATVMASYLINSCVAYSHMNQRKLKPRAIKCIFLGYPDGVKGSRLWGLDDVKPKIIINRDVVFNESLMYKDTLKGAGAADYGKEVEFEVELHCSRVEPIVDPYIRKNPGNEDEDHDEEPQQQNLDNYVLVDDMAAYAFAIAEEEDTHEPITFKETINSYDNDEWVRAMEEEMSSLKKNHTSELADQPHGQKLVSCKWLYKIKEGIKGIQKPRYKARLVARGFTQRAWIDYNEVFSPVVRHTSIRVILSLTACEGYELEQLDVKTSFLHGNLKETIYMRQPPGFEEGTGNKEFATCMHIYLLLYVDDMLIACKSMSEIEYTKGLLRKEFDMKELGPARKILGMEIFRDRGNRTLKVSQSGYVQKILNNYRVDNGKSVFVPLGAHFKVSLKDCQSNDWDVEIISKVPYANVVGSLMYLMVCTRSDIAYAVSIVSRYLANPGKNHWEAVKWILKYLKGTADVGLVYGRDQGKHVDVDGFVDADYAKDPEKGRLITGEMVESKVIKVANIGREMVESKVIKVANIGTKDNAADAFTKHASKGDEKEDDVSYDDEVAITSFASSRGIKDKAKE